MKSSSVARTGAKAKRTSGKPKPTRAAAKSQTEPAQGQVAAGVLHEVPEDIREVLVADAGVLATWNALTPIQRNEWICWTTIVKKPETRADHVRRIGSDLREGKRQPCCWPGCPHRRPSAKKWFRNP